MMFALGVSLIPSQLPKAQIMAFFEAFGRLPQRVIMRMERPEGIKVPENILLRKFLPQQAILAHSKVTLYFGHGGVNGLMEAIYYRLSFERNLANCIVPLCEFLLSLFIKLQYDCGLPLLGLQILHTLLTQ